MEGEKKPSALSRPSPSFRLRCASLNAVRLRRVFDLFDHNGDGEITVEELALALDRLGLGADLTDLRATIDGYIQPGHQGLAYEDFEKLHSALGEALFGQEVAGEDEAGVREEEEEEEEEDGDMEEAFKVFDEDGDGFISAAELQAVLAKLGLPEGKSMARVMEMICSVDRNHDGRVDFLEFKHMMRSIAVKSS
ncbi:calcium-binding protein CML protein [Dioscorea alata]|uniref:Calcium-binding protein CML protein n=1 Tax=Dioscorea alata TaxID=55571 RepID=A0ACB7VT46_DIOAL|nr:calcium-binding protein CML protein [Dioscorea alata]